ncbi:hypothetical protein [Polyangium aurulentum]|uniref:hypothetical protein n=1 Tax=Polyangium aurulentum TaxID=2567896 RepID=UPI0010ADD67A|nr:hypothetical protein [Polyangium aurulentum]UQA63238.1 hypothetical protein E8A73_023345 [Polyangium aurulentum]
MSVVQVWPRVAAADVLAGASDEEIAKLEGLLSPFIEHTADLEESVAVRIVRALTRPTLVEGALKRWIEPYRELGLESCWRYAALWLRVRGEKEFCEVWETAGEVLDTWWGVRDRDMIRIGDERRRKENAPAQPLYTLRLTVTVPRDTAGPKPSNAQAPPLPVRPLGARQSDLAEVQALASFLAPRVEATFNGKARLREQPLLAPICALAATVWTAMQHPKMQTRHQSPLYKRAAFYACLDGLALGEHRETAERILRRDHARHIHIDASSAPEGYVDPKWRGGLGIFAGDKDGHLTQVTEHNRKQFAPLILFSLAGAEPW